MNSKSISDSDTWWISLRDCMRPLNLSKITTRSQTTPLKPTTLNPIAETKLPEKSSLKMIQPQFWEKSRKSQKTKTSCLRKAFGTTRWSNWHPSAMTPLSLETLARTGTCSKVKKKAQQFTVLRKWYWPCLNCQSLKTTNYWMLHSKCWEKCLNNERIWSTGSRGSWFAARVTWVKFTQH